RDADEIEDEDPRDPWPQRPQGRWSRCRHGLRRSRRRRRRFLTAEETVDEALDREPGAVNAAPHDERPVRTVPQAAEQHGQHQVSIRLALALAAAAERNVEVVAQPG